MPSKNTKILEFNQYKKSDKAPFIIYADLECLTEKIDRCKNNPENSSKTNVSEHIPSCFSMSTTLSFKSIESKHDEFCESLREHATKIINFKKKNRKSLTNEQQNSYENSKICYICKDKFEDQNATDKNYRKVRDHCHYTGEYRGAANSTYNIKYSVPKETPVVFHNGSNYGYHFIIKELAEKFEKRFTCLGENTKKYITFTVSIGKKVTTTDKDGEEFTKSISFRSQFIDTARFMANS